MEVGEEQACTALGTALKITSFNTFDIEAPAKGTADRPFSEDRICHFACPQNVQPTPITQGIAPWLWGSAFRTGPGDTVSPWSNQRGMLSIPDHVKREGLSHCRGRHASCISFFSFWFSGLFFVFASKRCTAASREHFYWPSWPLALMLFSGLSLGTSHGGNRLELCPHIYI